ncbi:MAG: glycosyltransferase [Lachnospiraceae bacterium]|nr:glycosyltransferase [Lachnospiraceae bacterium]
MAALSVLMSVYIREKPEYADECFKSLLAQTVTADEWVIVEDGPLTEELYSLLDRYQADNPGLIRRIVLDENRGLGSALAVGVPACKNDLIARMDTDDIARPDRFAKQLDLFERDPQLDICGSNIDEFEDDKDHIVAKRTVPASHEDIVRYQKRRDGFNHMTVLFRKKAVLDAGNYRSCPLMEDTYLWVRMIQNGAKCANIDESLVYVRIGRDMFGRRGGWSYFRKYRTGRKMVLKTGFISRWDYIYTLMIQFFVALAPGWIRRLIFTKLLHR